VEELMGFLRVEGICAAHRIVKTVNWSSTLICWRYLRYVYTLPQCNV